jgi:hypothetical protein
MSYITDQNIHLYYTQSYRKKISNVGRATPTYFSLIDSEVNYNLINIDDEIVDNNGFENNSVTADLDLKIFDVPVLEPTEDTANLHSAMYGYWDLGSVSNIENIGSELTQNESEFTKFKKYTLKTEYVQIPDQQLLNGNAAIQVNANVYGMYKDYFTIQSSCDFFLYDNGIVEDKVDVLRSLSGGMINNIYPLYRNDVPNRGAAQKQLSENKVRVISSSLTSDTRGYLRMSDHTYFPTHKTFLHFYAGSEYVIIDVTGNDMTASIPYPFNALFVSQLLNAEEKSSIAITAWFESMFKAFLNNQFVLFHSRTEKIHIELVLK